MKKLLTLLLAGMMVCCFSQCSKTGPEGPQGEQGAAGTEGPRGANGSKGDKGDKGATGAKGDKGDKGATGTTGPKGDKGDKGATGNANVKSTGWISITSSKWDYGYGAGDVNLQQPGDHGMYYSSSGLGSITEAESKGGVVLVYAKLPSSPNNARMLPFKFSYSTGGFSGVVELRFAYGTTPNTAHWVTPGAALVSGTWNTNANVIKIAYLPTVKFCMVVIPASTFGRSAAPPVDYSDYEAVKAYYHLQD